MKIFLLIGKYTFYSSPETPSCLLSKFLRFGKYIQTDNNPINHLTKFVSKNINFLYQLFERGNLKSCNDLKLEYNLKNGIYFRWLQTNKLFQTSGNI